MRSNVHRRILLDSKSEPALVRTLKLVKFEFLLELCNVLLSNADFFLSIFIELVDLLGCDLGVLRLELFAFHHINLKTLHNEGRHIENLASTFCLAHLFGKAALEDVQDLPLLLLLAIVETDLDLELFLFLLLAATAALFLGFFLSTTSKDTAAAPDENEAKHGTTE